jgi:PAS domain S-box-containing protein
MPHKPRPAAPTPAGRGRADRLLFERNPLPMWVIDIDSRRFLAANQAAVRAYGYSEAEFRAMSMFDIRPPEDRARLEAYLASRPAAAPSPGPTIWRHRRRNGEVFEVEIVSDAIAFEGRPSRLVMARDITALRRAEAELLASERRYRRIVETASEGIWTIDAEGRTTFVNPALARMLGCTPAEMLNRPFTDFMDEETRAEALQRFERRRQGRSERHDFRLSHRDGHAVWVSMSASPIFDDAGTFAGAMAMVTDITERVQAAARNAARTELMTMVASGAPLDTVLEALVRMVEGELPGARCCVMGLRAGRLRILAAPSLPGFFNQASDGLVPGPLAGSCGLAAHRGERVIAADIGHHPAWAAYRSLAVAAGLQACWSEPIVGRVGTLLGTLGVYHGEVHSPPPSELALVAGAARLAAIVVERRVADDALRESQKMEALGTLAGGIAHDFNNILGAILGNLDLLQREVALPPAATTRLQQINLSAQRARALVQQILAFGRRQPQSLRDQPLKPLVEESMALLRASLPAGVQLRAALSDEPLHVRADATQVQQVLMNLCSNAWHALPVEGGVIELGFDDAPPAPATGTPGTLPNAASWVHLWVRDSGSGMDEATRSRIFEPFFTTKPVGRGTGLGLAVVHGIVSDHGGVIGVDSAPGRGSTFHVYLPQGDAELAIAEPAAEATAAAPRAGTAPTHILCVDDDDVMRLAEEGVLQALGYLVTSLADAAEALDAVRTAPQAFDLVVADYNMPGLSGLELARALAALRPELPVIISTGYITDALRKQAAELGVRELVRKENTVEELGAAVRRVLANAPDPPPDQP